MKISDLLKLSTDNLRRRKGRTALTVIGVVVGTCAIVVMISLGIAANKRTEETLASWSDLTQITVLGYSDSADTPALDDKMVASLKEMEYVIAATPMYNFQNFNGNVLAGAQGRYSSNAGSIIGMEPSAIEPMGYELKSGDYLADHKGTPKKIPVLVGEDFAYNFEDTKKSYSNPKRYRWKETDENGNATVEPFFNIEETQLVLQMITGYDDQGNPKTKDYELNVVGILKQDYAKEGSSSMIMSISDMKWLESEYKKASGGSSGGGGGVMIMGGGSGSKTGGYNQVFVKTDYVDHVESVEAAIKKIGYETYSMTETRKQAQKEVFSSQLMLGGLAAISLLVAALNIANTMTMAIYERTKEIGVMKVLGCRIGKIREMFLIESGTIGFIGGVIGVLLSLLLSFVLNHLTEWLGALSAVLASMGIQFDASSVNLGGLLNSAGSFGGMGGEGTQLSIIPLWLVIAALLFATIVGLLSGIAPANRAVKISALEAIRHD